ncbi:MAG: bifunctional phosphopantothenoylcysteine decarboxylase/phosphopantothenate--cysteine ligase CoaBC [Hyphomicrobiales bacterium]|nr:MAG: bifunctional phosphopantothenoylcysteine decarboxylase/phosphopantothenate--cysteine ligase CoaBC [Hyphomicrobiales bacterium]
MASITIRNLDESIKQALRERAAQNGHSMEEEARLRLGQTELAESQPIKASASSANYDASLGDKRILLIIGGGIAAYKCLDLIRRLKERGAAVRVIMTPAASEFITPLSVGALSGDKVFSDLFDRDDEHDVGHIRLSREADIIVVAPATADLMAKMANGLANDLASTTLMATNKPVLIAPAMNTQMWNHRATRRNHQTLLSDGIHFIGPNSGEMAESNEAGFGRMAEPMEILGAVQAVLAENEGPKPLSGMRAIVTSGPTHEPIDPVRYIANRSSGKQGHAIAEALAQAGAEVILVSGPVNIPDPKGVEIIKVQTAREMQKIVETALPADIGVFVAAVADWRTVKSSDEKLKKKDGKGPSSLKLTENPDILKGIGHHKNRPKLVIGFAAETEHLEKHGKAKLKRKNADWIIANDVSPETGIMGGNQNTVHLISKEGVESWPKLSKQEVAERLVERMVAFFDVETIEI